MKYYISSAFLDTGEIIEIARAAEELGYDGIGIPDHVVNVESLATPYPYTKDGQRRWQPFTDWPDPWVLVGALAQVTTRLRFVTTVYVPAMRTHPPVVSQETAKIAAIELVAADLCLAQVRLRQLHRSTARPAAAAAFV